MNNNTGFTLLELILAIAIVGLIAGLSFSTVSVQENAGKAALNAMESDQLARVTFDRLVQDIERMVSLTQSDEQNEENESDTAFPRLNRGELFKLITRNGSREPVANVIYRIIPAPDVESGPYHIYRQEESTLGFDPGVREILCRRVLDLRIEYFDSFGKKSIYWKEKNLPKVIQLRLTIAEGESGRKNFERMVMPLISFNWEGQ